MKDSGGSLCILAQQENCTSPAGAAAAEVGSVALGGVCADHGTDLLLLFVIYPFLCIQPSTTLERNLPHGHSLEQANLSAHLACGAGQVWSVLPEPALTTRATQISAVLKKKTIKKPQNISPPPCKLCRTSPT